MRIVLTNDDGIEDYQRRLLPLARPLATFAEVTVVVSSRDRSGSSHFTSLGSRKRALESCLRHVCPQTEDTRRIEVHEVEGYPADCVLLAVRGILRHQPPDLVISGLNGGPNLGISWLHSGTVGAARMAACYGIPALAVSGVDFGHDGAVENIAEWLARLARSPVVKDLEPGQYLTVGIPKADPHSIRGIRIARRSPALGAVYLERTQDPRRLNAGAPERTVWLSQPPEEMADPPPGTDLDLYRQGYIVLTPMRADEHDDRVLEAWKTGPLDIPAWRP